MSRVNFINYIISKECVRWDDLIKKFGFEGDEEFIIEEYNIVLWRGISIDFKYYITDDWNNNKISFIPVDVSAYQLAGVTVNKGYSIGKSIPENGYKDKKWFPTLITYKVR